MSGTIDKKETLPAMSTEEDLIPVEKISGEWYTDIEGGEGNRETHGRRPPVKSGSPGPGVLST